MTRFAATTLKVFPLIARTALVSALLAAPVLAVPATAATAACGSRLPPSRRAAPASCCWSACSAAEGHARFAPLLTRLRLIVGQAPLPNVTLALYNGSWKSEFTPNPPRPSSRPEPFVRQTFTDARQAVDALKDLYARNTRVPPQFIRRDCA